MAYPKREYVPHPSMLRRGLGIALICTALAARAADNSPRAVIVTPDPVLAVPYASAMNEDGVVEANAARVENGIVYLEYKAGPGTAYDALTAAAR